MLCFFNSWLGLHAHGKKRKLPGRNLLARFTVVSTQEDRSLEEIHEQDLLLDMQPAVQNGAGTMDVLLRMAWLHDDEPLQIEVNWDNGRLLNVARNAMKRAGVDHGEAGDPMLVWVRKADALLRQCFIGAYLEAGPTWLSASGLTGSLLCLVLYL